MGRTSRVRVIVATLAGCAALQLPGAAAAKPPVLLSVGHQDRHPTATWQAMPGADSATIYFAISPNRATDGQFLTENVKHTDFLTDDEIQRGGYLDENRLDPGRTYYVLLRVSDYECEGGDACFEGFSNMLTLTIPKPAQTFRGSVDVLRYVGVAHLSLVVTPLGEGLPYRVCWTLKSKKRVCVSGTANGYDWDDPGRGFLRVSLRGMAKRTTFTWYVKGQGVASRQAATVRA